MVSTLVNRGFSKRRASTTWPTIRSRLRLTAAKLMRTWNAMRVFSGMTRTRPQRFTSLANSRNRRTAWGALLAKCSRNVYCEQKCDWFRFANARLQFGHCHNPSARMTKKCTADHSSCGGYLEVTNKVGILTPHTLQCTRPTGYERRAIRYPAGKYIRK